MTTMSEGLDRSFAPAAHVPSAAGRGKSPSRAGSASFAPATPLASAISP
jgi:hypothetical protein